MSDAERDGRGRERRVLTPATGVPVQPTEEGSFEPEDHFTPVSDVFGQLEERMVLSERERQLVMLVLRLTWQHTANMEMRARKRSDTQDTSILRKELDAAQLAIVDIRGESGNNGKLGALKERVDKAEARKWWAITFIAGLIVTIIGSAFAFGSRIGALETDVETLKARALRARNASPPEYPAARETP